MQKPDIDCYRNLAAMGTQFEVFLSGGDAEHLDAVAVAVLEEIARLDSTLSRFDPRSEIARLNRRAWQETVRLDRELTALLARCEQARILTGGFFDVTRGAGLRLDSEHCLLRFTQADTTLDLGGIVKGYALDCGREWLTRFGVTCGLLHGGTSSVLAVGERAWPIDVRHPLRSKQLSAQLALRNQGLSCSAVRHAGQVVSDVVNPLTGLPLAGADACLVLADNATDAEIFSTALLAMGQSRAAQFVASHPELNLTVGWLNTAADITWLSWSDIV